MRHGYGERHGCSQEEGAREAKNEKISKHLLLNNVVCVRVGKNRGHRKCAPPNSSMASPGTECGTRRRRKKKKRVKRHSTRCCVPSRFGWLLLPSTRAQLKISLPRQITLTIMVFFFSFNALCLGYVRSIIRLFQVDIFRAPCPRACPSHCALGRRQSNGTTVKVMFEARHRRENQKRIHKELLT